MPLSIPIVWSDAHSLHEPGGEVWVGVRTPGTEVPARAERIREVLEAAGAPIVAAEPAPDVVALRFHDPALVAWLREAWDAWEQAGLDEDPGQDRVVPYLFPHPGLTGELPVPDPAAVTARAGRRCYDTMTLIGPGTWEAARGAVDAAVTAATVAARDGAAYACCRPPGHHATGDAYGGSCYLNNAAVAAEALRRGGFDRVAIVDIDAHHGNGTASIFYDRADVFYGSVHIDPGAGWFPHVVGFADETGTGAGTGTTLNVPLPPETANAGWLAGVERLAEASRAHGSTALVVSLGVDAAADDPNSPLRVTVDGYRRAGELLAALELPTVLVQEGGYHLPTLGALVASVLEAFAG